MRTSRFTFYKGELVKAQPARPLAGVLPGCNPKALHASAWLTIIGHSGSVGKWFYFEETRKYNVHKLVRIEKALQMRAYNFGYTKTHLTLTATPNHGIIFMWRQTPDNQLYGPQRQPRLVKVKGRFAKFALKRKKWRKKHGRTPTQASRRLRFSKTFNAIHDERPVDNTSDLKREIQQLHG